jgi:hypothetical protein
LAVLSQTHSSWSRVHAFNCREARTLGVLPFALVQQYL